MAHHSSEAEDVVNQLFAQQLHEAANKAQGEINQMGFGPTGQFPDGKLTEHDEGEITLGIAIYKGQVVMDFGTPTAWVGFTAEQALQIAESLMKCAYDIMGERNENL